MFLLLLLIVDIVSSVNLFERFLLIVVVYGVLRNFGELFVLVIVIVRFVDMWLLFLLEMCIMEGMVRIK